MNENDIIADNSAENVEAVATEEAIEDKVVEKTYTQSELNEIVRRRLARKEAKIRKEYDSKYGELEATLKAGTGKESIEELTSAFGEFYKSKGVELPKKPTYTDKEHEILAKAEAEDIIGNGMEEVIEEVDRLAKIGFANLSARDKVLFKELAEYRKTNEMRNSLASHGVSESEYDKVVEFARDFNANTPTEKIVKLYRQSNPKKDIPTIGSVKNTNSTDDGVKDFYTPEEARKFTRKDIEKNPALLRSIENSMKKWKK